MMARQEKTKVRLLTAAGSAEGTWQAGEVINLPSAAAKRMVEAGLAEFETEKRTATRPPKETRG